MDPIPSFAPGAPSREERTVAMICHGAGLVAGHFFPGVGNIIAPLIIWQVKREMSPFVDAHGREAVNAQISLTLYFIVAIILIFLLIGIVLVPVLYIAAIVYVILAVVAANEGRMFRYPLIIRFLK